MYVLESKHYTSNVIVFFFYFGISSHFGHTSTAVKREIVRFVILGKTKELIVLNIF